MSMPVTAGCAGVRRPPGTRSHAHPNSRSICVRALCGTESVWPLIWKWLTVFFTPRSCWHYYISNSCHFLRFVFLFCLCSIFQYIRHAEVQAFGEASRCAHKNTRTQGLCDSMHMASAYIVYVLWVMSSPQPLQACPRNPSHMRAAYAIYSALSERDTFCTQAHTLVLLYIFSVQMPC